VSFAAITLCVASQRVYIVVSVNFVIASVRKLLDTPLYIYASSGIRTHDHVLAVQYTCSLDRAATAAGSNHVYLLRHNDWCLYVMLKSR
jgi:hypothetical protein